MNIISRERGVKLELFNAPASCVVDGEIIRGLQEHLFSVLRDILYVSKLEAEIGLNLSSPAHITNLVFPFCVTPDRCVPANCRISSSAGVATRSTMMNITMRGKSAITLACGS